MSQVKTSSKELMQGIIKVLKLVKNKSANPQKVSQAIKNLEKDLNSDSTLNKITEKDLKKYKDIIQTSIDEGGLDPRKTNLDIYGR